MPGLAMTRHPDFVGGDVDVHDIARACGEAECVNKEGLCRIGLIDGDNRAGTGVVHDEAITDLAGYLAQAVAKGACPVPADRLFQFGRQHGTGAADGVTGFGQSVGLRIEGGHLLAEGGVLRWRGPVTGR